MAAETAVPYVYQENTSPVTQESPSEMENFLQNFWETPDEQKSNDNAHITSNDEGIVVANIMPNVASCVSVCITFLKIGCDSKHIFMIRLPAAQLDFNFLHH